MAKYLILYRAPQSASEKMSEEISIDAAAGWPAFNAWRAKVGDAVVDPGAPLEAITPVSRPIGGFSILEAESPAAVQGLLEGHPHTAWGGTVDILEVLDTPIGG